ncbi:unnamed protein product, partial [Mesorhabditis belari]|uniref:Methyltransferase domain-containing protein n=1 Tax=Mesorhabditis belari TaxID=2138241 RepID=A0AAF3JA08_9BILA
MNQGENLVQALASQYMVDFFIDRPFERLLPRCWQEFFSSLGNESIIEFCDPSRTPSHLNQPQPLGLLALRVLASSLSTARVHVGRPEDLLSLFEINEKSDELMPDFSLSLSIELKRKIKAKKLHEIERILEVIRCARLKSQFENVVDIGAGVGHLTRAISMSLPVRVHSIEGNEKLVSAARKLDSKFSSLLVSDESTWIKPERKAEYVSLNAETKIPGEDAGVCLVGVHACGDLSSTIIRMFTKHPQITCLILFGCCYHKLNAGADKLYQQKWGKCAETMDCNIETLGYPLSNGLTSSFTYAARELACYAREQYMASEDFDIRQQIFRALLEWIVVRSTIDQLNGPVRHLPFHGVSASANLEFGSYIHEMLKPYPELLEPVKNTLSSMDLDIDDFVKRSTSSFLSILALRIMIAPLIESCIVDDRVQYIRDAGHSAISFPLFNSVVSPRNICIAAFKKL